MRDTPNWKKWVAINQEHHATGKDLTSREGVIAFRVCQLKLNEQWKFLSKEERRWALESSFMFGFDLSGEEYEKEIAIHIDKECYVEDDAIMPSIEELEGRQEKEPKKMKFDLETIGKLAIGAYIVYALIVLSVFGTIGYIAVHFLLKFW